MDPNTIQMHLFRWIHVVAGILWIGLLYFFNFVNGPFAATMDADTKKKVVPQLMPRALFWFRWGAAVTWLTGLALLVAVFYWEKENADFTRSVPGALDAVRMMDAVHAQNWPADWPIMGAVLLGGLLAAALVYDLLARTVIKDFRAAFVVGLAASAVLPWALEEYGFFRFRGYAIHLGAVFGSIMAYNVWFRIWPAQAKIIAAIRDGQAPDAALVSRAGQRSKHNTYMSVPLVFLMLSEHQEWASRDLNLGYFSLPHTALLPVITLLGWGLTYFVFKGASKVKGF